MIFVYSRVYVFYVLFCINGIRKKLMVVLVVVVFVVVVKLGGCCGGVLTLRALLNTCPIELKQPSAACVPFSHSID